jgi:hypothetical protein
MKRDDIIRMANEAWLTPVAHIPNILEFAALVAAAEREACAKVAEQIEHEIFDAIGDPRIREFKPKIAFAIRERGAP